MPPRFFTDQLQRLRKGLSADHPAQRRREWLTPCWGSQVWRLTLIGVTDHLDADGLWDPSAGSNRGLAEAHSNDPNRRLRRALQDHQRWRQRPGGGPVGRQVLQGHRFTDLIIGLPPAVWERDQAEQDGQGAAVLADNLAWHHARSFPDNDNRRPRCLVRPCPGLEPGRVECLFGRGVYLPEADAAPAFLVLPHLDGEPLCFPELAGAREQGRPTNQPSAFYADQETLLITPAGDGPLPLPGWQAGADRCLLLRRSGPDSWQARDADGEQLPVRRGPAGSWTVELRPLTGQVLSLELNPNRAGPGSGLGHSVAVGSTVLPGAAAPALAQTLALVAIALPTLAPGLRRWTLWLDPTGGIATPAQITRAEADLIALDLDRRGLRLRRPGAAPEPLGQQVTAPCPLGHGDAELLPSPLPREPALLRLPRPEHYALALEPLIVGRSDADGPAPDLALDQLSQPDALLWAGPDPGIGLGNLGLSRRHAQVWVEDGKLQADPLKDGCRLLRLGPDLRPCAEGGALSLDPGEHLLAGPFLLRYCA